MTYSTIARSYIDGVLDDTIPACLHIRRACERAVKDLARQSDPNWPYVFDPKKAQQVCDFIGRLKHIKDSIATRSNEPIVLLPFQRFILETVFGWQWKDSGKRRFRRAYVEIPRGNGKSTLASGIALFCGLAESVGGAEVVCAASNVDQTGIVVDCARAMLKKDPELTRKLGAKVLAHKIVVPETQSIIRGLPAKATSVEGLSTSCAILDEVQAQRGRQLHDTLSAGCAKRDESLFLMVTTAGDDSAGVGWELHSYSENLLAGEIVDDSFFAALYSIDLEDPWDDPQSWAKANPGWAISVDPKSIAEEAARAVHMPAQRAVFRAKHLCEWVLSGGSEEGFLDPATVRGCYEKELNEAEFTGAPAIIGLDLASRLDLCAAVRVHMRRIDGRQHYYAFCKAWLPADTIRDAGNSQYKGWLAQGHLVETPGSVTDLDEIEEFAFQAMQDYQIRDVNFDPLQSNQLITHLKKRSGRDDAFFENQQFAKFLTQGMVELQEAVAARRLHFNSPALLWCLLNLRAKHVGMNLCYPVRPKDRALKIDCAVALVMALRSCAVTPLDETKRPPGVFFIDNYPAPKGPTPEDQAKCDEQKQNAAEYQQEVQRKLYAIPPGNWLVILDGNGQEKKIHRTIAAIRVAKGEWTLVRVED